MSSNTDYELEIGHETKSYLESTISHLELRDEAWVFDCSKIRKKRGKDFYSFKCYIWPNDNAYENSLESEFEDVLDEMDELQITGSFIDDYGAGRISEKGSKVYESYHSETL